MEKIIFSKFSRERKSEFAISTVIVDDDFNNRKVIKRSLTEDSKVHINNLLVNYGLLQLQYNQEDVYICKCDRLNDNEVAFEFIYGTRFDYIINNHIENKNYTALYNDIVMLKNLIYSVSNKIDYIPTKEFNTIFGDIELSNDYIAATYSNIDLITSNIILNDKINIVDYEWVFNFPIPLKYILFRAIFLHGKINLLSTEIKAEIYEIADISKEEEAIFFNMEVNLQNYISGNINTIDSNYNLFGKKSYQLSLVNGLDLTNECKISLESSNKYILIDRVMYSQNHIYKVVKLNYKQYNKNIIFEPIDTNCIIKLIKFNGKIDGGWKSLELLENNSDLCINNDYYFRESKPFFKFKNEQIDEIEIEFLLYKKNDIFIGQLIDFIYENSDLKTKINLLEESKKDLKEKEKELITKSFRLEENIELLKNNLFSLTNENKQLSNDYELLYQSNLELEKENEVIEAKNEELIIENDKLQKKIDSLIITNDTLSVELDDIHNTVWGKIYRKLNRR